MDAIILAAGEGKRFFSGKVEQRPLPFNLEYPIPKSLFPVKVKSSGNGMVEKPILGALINTLFEGGIEKIFIGTGHLAGKIKEYVEREFKNKKIHVVEPDPSIDFRKGPLFTLATVLQYLSSASILTNKGQDKIFMIVPADLIIDRKAIWYIAGPAGRGMMSSRSMIHALVENRSTAKHPSQFSPLSSIIPESFTHLFERDLLECPLVPLMSVHVEILLVAISFLNKGLTKFSQFIKQWLADNYSTDREFKVNIHLINSSYLGEAFTWHDIDTWEDILNAGL